MKRKRALCVIAAIVATACVMFSSCQSFPGGNLFDEKALKYLDMEWLEKPKRILKESDSSERNKQDKYYVYFALLEGEEYYFDYVNNLFSELLTRYKYVTYETDYITVRHDLLYTNDYKFVSESTNFDDYISEYEVSPLGYYFYKFEAIVADKIYYPNDEFYPKSKGKATKLKNSIIIRVGLKIPLTEEAYAEYKGLELNIYINKNEDYAYLE